MTTKLFSRATLTRADGGSVFSLLRPKKFSVRVAAPVLLAGFAAACGDSAWSERGGLGEPPEAAAGFEVAGPGIGAELELPEIQLIRLKKLAKDGDYELLVDDSEEGFDTSPLQKKVVSTSATPPGTLVPVLSVTGDIHMPFSHEMSGTPPDEAFAESLYISRTLEIISGPHPADVAAQKKVHAHMSLFWHSLVQSVVPWDDVHTVGENWEEVVVTRGETDKEYGEVTAKRLLELGTVGRYALPKKIYGLAMLEDVVDEYNKTASEEYQLDDWLDGKDYALIFKKYDIPGVHPQASFGITAKGYNAGNLAANFRCNAPAAQSSLSEAKLRKRCRKGGGWANLKKGVTACFPSDCLGRACYLSGTRAFAAASSGGERFLLADQARDLMGPLTDEWTLTEEDVQGPIGDAVKAALITLRCSTLALAQDVNAPEWKLKSMIGNLPKVTWSGFSDSDFGAISTPVTDALNWLRFAKEEELVKFACNPNGPVDVGPKLFISSPGDVVKNQSKKKRAAYCREQVETLFANEETLGGGRAFTPGRIAGEPAFVVESRLASAPVTNGFAASEIWLGGKPQQLKFTGNIKHTVRFVCEASGLVFDGNQCVAPAGTKSPPPVADDELSSGDKQPAPAADDEASAGTKSPPPVVDEVSAGTKSPPPVVDDEVSTGDKQPAPVADDEVSTGDKQPAPVADDELSTGDNQPRPVADDEVSAGTKSPRPVADDEVSAGTKSPRPVADDEVNAGDQQPAPEADSGAPVVS